MKYKIIIKKKILRKIEKLPQNIQDIFYELINDLKEKGPIQKKWPNFSKLNKNNFHCHLNYRYVACWKNQKKSIILEVYYVGSREKAPY